MGELIWEHPLTGGRENTAEESENGSGRLDTIINAMRLDAAGT
jgi:hypothetical protein